MATNYLEDHDLKLHYSLLGEGIPIIFLHGFALDYRLWHPQLIFFSRTHQTLAYDLRGFGNSLPFNSRYHHHEDLKKLLDHLGIKKAHFVGLSLGGEVALDFCVTYPDRVISLALLNSSLSGYQSTVDWSISTDKDNLKQAKQNWLSHEVFAATYKNIRATQALRDMVDHYSGWHWLNPDPRNKPAPPTKDRLREVSCPALVMIGQDDLEYFHDIAKILVLEIPKAKKVMIKQAGHLVNLEQPEVVNSLLQRFFESCKGVNP